MYRIAGLTVSLAAAGLLAIAPALAQQAPAGTTGYAAKLTASEKQALKNAAAASMAQIDIARVAEQRSSNADVKKLANQIVTDQTKVLDEIRNYAMKNNVTLPSQVSAKEQKRITALSSLSGEPFDRAALKGLERQQNMQMTALHTEAMATKNPELQQFARSILADVRQQQTDLHTQMASMGIPTTAPMTDESGHPKK